MSKPVHLLSRYVPLLSFVPSYLKMMHQINLIPYQQSCYVVVLKKEMQTDSRSILNVAFFQL